MSSDLVVAPDGTGWLVAAQVGQEVAQVERGFALADRVEIDQASLCAFENNLRVRVIAVAEAGWQRVGLLGVGADLVGPAFEPLGQLGRVAPHIGEALAPAGAKLTDIVRLTWYLTSKGEYQASGAGIGAAWKETLGKNFPPSTLLYIDGLVDVRAKVEIEVTAYIPAS